MYIFKQVVIALAYVGSDSFWEPTPNTNVYVYKHRNVFGLLQSWV